MARRSLRSTSLSTQPSPTATAIAVPNICCTGVATARGDLVELAELFALNVLRVDRAVERLLEDRERDGMAASGPPVLSLRARDALATPRLDGNGPTGPFELLHGLLRDDNSGACRVVLISA